MRDDVDREASAADEWYEPKTDIPVEVRELALAEPAERA